MSCIEPMVSISVNSGTLQIDTVRTVTLNTVTVSKIDSRCKSSIVKNHILNTLIVFLTLCISDMGMRDIRIGNSLTILS